jgi:hypothetical protein
VEGRFLGKDVLYLWTFCGRTFRRGILYPLTFSKHDGPGLRGCLDLTQTFNFLRNHTQWLPIPFFSERRLVGCPAKLVSFRYNRNRNRKKFQFFRNTLKLERFGFLGSIKKEPKGPKGEGRRREMDGKWKGNGREREGERKNQREREGEGRWTGNGREMEGKGKGKVKVRVWRGG